MQESVTSCGTQQFQLPSLLQAAATGSQQQQCSAGEAALLTQQPPYLSHQLCNTWLLWASTGADGHSLSLTGHLTTTFLFLWSPPAAVLACSSSPLWLSVLPAQGAGVEHTEQCPDQVMMAQLWCKAMQTICIILYPPPEQPVSWTSPQQEKNPNQIHGTDPTNTTLCGFPRLLCSETAPDQSTAPMALKKRYQHATVPKGQDKWKLKIYVLAIKSLTFLTAPPPHSPPFFWQLE